MEVEQEIITGQALPPNYQTHIYTGTLYILTKYLVIFKNTFLLTKMNVSEKLNYLNRNALYFLTAETGIQTIYKICVYIHFPLPLKNVIPFSNSFAFAQSPLTLSVNSLCVFFRPAPLAAPTFCRKIDLARL